MSEISQADRYLLDQVRRGEADAWSQLVQRYHGRLLAFALARLPQRADAEDVVQDTFLGFLKSLHNFRAQASLETYLFSILRRFIINQFRGRKNGRICLLQDIYRNGADGQESSDVFQHIESPDPTASWYLRRDEQHHLLSEALTQGLRELLNSLKKSLNFRDLQIVELIFYCNISNKDVAKYMDMNEKSIAVIKHRCIGKVRNRVAKSNITVDWSADDFENLLTQTWQTHRLSCLKRSTIGAYLLKTLQQNWSDYVDFHLNKLGCHFCRANFEDLQHQTEKNKKMVNFKERIMESTVGFLHKS